MSVRVDFVFLDSDSVPYRVKKWGDKPWLFYWRENRGWVSLREASEADILRFQVCALPQEKADLYKGA